LTTAVAELLGEGVVVENQSPTPVITEATIGAVWSLFHHHVVRDWSQRPQVAATLSYMALAPVVGAPVILGAIGDEQRR
jgi:hypothetical protein